jgi:circadian clock protein KaiC
VKNRLVPLPKSPTGIVGFDAITGGGLPTGRPSLFCGIAGSGKTLFATTFLVNGILQFDEPGVFMSFEERVEDLAANVASLGYEVENLVTAGKLVIDYVRVERGEIEENGEYDLDGLFIRLAHAVAKVGAKRVVLDTIEVLFGGFSNLAILRSEIRRLFEWIKEQGLTAVITAERGDGQLTRQGLEEYISDCVVLIDNRVRDEIATRRLRIVKYRGSAHGTNEYPFLIDESGITVFPITAAGLGHGVSNEVVSSGISGLDAMLGKSGFYKGSSLLITGVSGVGKTTIGAVFADAACRRGERCLFCVFEESPAQICRNARSIGLDLQQHMNKGLLVFEAARPSLYGLETHLAQLQIDLNHLSPDVVVIDPISALRGPSVDVHAILLRMVDLLKSRGITTLFTSVSGNDKRGDVNAEEMSSLMDTVIRLVLVEANGEINRTLYVMKARGMGHSNQVREYKMTDAGIVLIEPYVGPEGVLTGTARATQVALQEAASLRRLQDAERRKNELTQRRDVMEREIIGMRAAIDNEVELSETMLREERKREATMDSDRAVDVGRRSGSA